MTAALRVPPSCHPAPPPDPVIVRAIALANDGEFVGWRFTKRSVPGESRWEPTGYEIVLTNCVIEVGLNYICRRSSSLFALAGQ